jgi:F0F1-type ATP synthase membrane subunit b/b'
MTIGPIILTLIIVAALLWVRSAFVSLNKDMRAILDRQDEIRARLDALEAR